MLKPSIFSKSSFYFTQSLLFRYIPLILCITLTIVGFIVYLPLAIVAGCLVVIGLYDIGQDKHAILKNYPIMGHFRFLFESIRPEIRQYFIEADQEKVPFSRKQRALVYSRAKNVPSTQAFGTLSNLYSSGYEWFLQSTNSRPPSEPDFRIDIGNHLCSQPYNASIFNISAMSFGSLSAHAIEALNKGAKIGGFLHDTGEGSASPYHHKHGGDLVLEIGTGYFGFRTSDGGFDEAKFAKLAQDDQIKMIEIKLSQGAKPGKGGVLPASKITEEIAKTRDIDDSQDCISPPSHREFSTPLELVAFWQRLRQLSGGKPVGFKLCVGQPWQFMAIVKAMIETENYPDFIIVDGAEGGTGAAPVEFMDHIGMPLHDGFMFVHNTLVGVGIRQHIKIGVSGKIISGFDVARMLALGADWCNSARGFMFALGCIQSRACHTNACPVGVATTDPYRQQALKIDIKAERVANFHKNTLKSVATIVGAVGVSHPSELHAHHIARREQDGQIKLLSKHYYFMDKGALLDNTVRAQIFQQMWAMARTDSFEPNDDTLIAYNKDSKAISEKVNARIDTLQIS